MHGRNARGGGLKSLANHFERGGSRASSDARSGAFQPALAPTTASRLLDGSPPVAAARSGPPAPNHRHPPHTGGAPGPGGPPRRGPPDGARGWRGRARRPSRPVLAGRVTPPLRLAKAGSSGAACLLPCFPHLVGVSRPLGHAEIIRLYRSLEMHPLAVLFLSCTNDRLFRRTFFFFRFALSVRQDAGSNSQQLGTIPQHLIVGLCPLEAISFFSKSFFVESRFGSVIPQVLRALGIRL